MEYRMVRQSGFSEVVEKKSRFLGEAVHAESPEEAEAYIAAVRKKHYDARHHCFAFLAGEPGTPLEVVRSSDDGEPSGTAGRPMLDILTGESLHRTLVVVTRYFGGTLLGTGGLVRCYGQAAKEAVKAAGIVTVRRGLAASVVCGYTAYGKLKRILEREDVLIRDTDFGENVTIEIASSEDRMEALGRAVTEATDGSRIFTVTGPLEYEI